MNKLIGAIVGFLLVKFFFLSEIEQMGFRLFINVISGNLDFGNKISIEKMLFSDTSLKLIGGTIAGYFIGSKYESNLHKEQNKINESQEEINNDTAQALPSTHVKCPDCRKLVRKDANLCRHCSSKLIPQN